MLYFTGIEKAILKIHVESQNVLDRQNNADKKNSLEVSPYMTSSYTTEPYQTKYFGISTRLETQRDGIEYRVQLQSPIATATSFFF